VKAGRAGERVKPGWVYVAPGGIHMRLSPNGILILDPAPEAIHRPSADELFRSVAAAMGANAVGVLLTGMGADGAAGLRGLADLHRSRYLHDAGGLTIVQDEATSAVFGMPQAAIRMGAVDLTLPLDDIAAAVKAALTRRASRRAP
jgi:two-component system chemotaxis response regulator CheB